MGKNKLQHKWLLAALPKLESKGFSATSVREFLALDNNELEIIESILRNGKKLNEVNINITRHESYIAECEQKIKDMNELVREEIGHCCFYRTEKAKLEVEKRRLLDWMEAMGINDKHK